MNFDLSQTETELLASLPEKEFDELRCMLHHTLAPGCKARLKEREALIRGLLDRLAR